MKRKRKVKHDLFAAALKARGRIDAKQWKGNFGKAVRQVMKWKKDLSNQGDKP